MTDAHHHFWKYDVIRHGWITDDMEVLKRDFLPADLDKVTAPSGVDGVVSVQADQSEQETIFLLECAEGNELVKGVVGWIDLRSAVIAERLEYFRQFAKLKGFRHIVQAEPSGFLLDHDFNRGIDALGKYGYTYDILVYEHQLEDVIKFLERHPDQPFVIDHVAKPRIAERSFEKWSMLMKRVAVFSNVWCKVSGMVTESAWGQWKYDHFVPYLDQVTQLFGAERLMYASDWPVCLLSATYEEQLGIVKRYYSSMTEEEQDKIFDRNAKRFYKL